MRVAMACALALAVSTSAFAQANTKAATEKTLIANETKINDAVMKGDLATFNSLVAADASMADSTGITKMSDFTKSFNLMKLTASKVADAQVTWIDDKGAVVVYTWTGKGTYQGQPIPEKTYCSTVWAERGGKWVAVYHQESTAMEPPPPPKKK